MTAVQQGNRIRNPLAMTSSARPTNGPVSLSEAGTPSAYVQCSLPTSLGSEDFIMNVLWEVTNIGGTTPTVDLDMLCSWDGGVTFVEIAGFNEQETANGLYAQQRSTDDQVPLAPVIRIRATVGSGAADGVADVDLDLQFPDGLDPITVSDWS